MNGLVESPRRRIMLVAGEPSGDLLGARLMAALKLRTMGKVQFVGIGGDHMGEQGLQSLFPMRELAVMGLVEVLPRARQILRRITEAAEAARQFRPDAVVTIDSPGFNFRLARKLRGDGIPLIHYVAPQVWAWRPGRARRAAALLDHLMVLLPFEPPWFEREGLSTSFVGHPAVEAPASRAESDRFRQLHNVAKDATLIAVLPGSRAGEVLRHLPVFGETIGLLAGQIPNLSVVLPTIPNLARSLGAAVKNWPVPAIVAADPADKYRAFAAADAALAASGTVALELAIAGTPLVVAYKVNPLSAWLARRLLTVRYVNLINILLDRPVIPEFLQENCRPDVLAAAVKHLIVDAEARAAQKAAAREAAKLLGAEGDPPSLRAADAVLAAVERGPRKR